MQLASQTIDFFWKRDSTGTAVNKIVHRILVQGVSGNSNLDDWDD